MNQKKEVPVIEPKDVFIGDEKATVTITEFADYETPQAAEVHQTVMNVLKKYEGRVRFNFRHFPLVRIHQKAHKAAEAAIGAAQEGRFLEMHELLLSKRTQLGTISLKSHARDAGVMNKNFLNDLISSKYGWYVQDDIREGLSRGVSEIPALFVNGKRLEGAPTLKKLTAQVEEALKGK